MWMLKDWYIDYTPTFGYENDDYEGCHVSGYVYGDGSPISGAQVTAKVHYPIYTPHPFYDQCTTYTAPDGLYAFDSLLPCSFWIKVNAAGYNVDSQLTDPLHSIEPLTNFNFTLVGILDNTITDLPPVLNIHPNPFTQKTEISYESTASRLQAKIFDVSGRLIKKISLLTFDFSLPTSVVWDGTNDYGHNVAPGVYFVLLPGRRIKVIKL